MDFKRQSVYQIYVPSFCDSNGDGIGDINGITSKLEYIKNLGVSYVWLTPIYVSPMKDNGYDVADYYEINPQFGSMKDFDNLIAKAKELDLKIMLDMVLNHTSTEHEWFKKALSGDKEYIDYYIFKDGVEGNPPTNWQSKFGGSAWQLVPSLNKYYLHLFDVSQADLNWANPKVRGELYKVVNFWLEKGVKGLRFDVINLISKPTVFTDDDIGDGRRFYTDGEHIHEYLKELNRETFGRFNDVMTVGEMSSTSIENCLKYASVDGDELHSVFNFHHLKLDYAGGDKWSLASFDFGAMKKLFNEWQTSMQAQQSLTALFWSNHDQPRVVSRLGNDQELRYESATMLATATYLMYGIPYIYQGEEIAMPNANFIDINQYRDVESINYAKILTQKYSPEYALKVLAARSRDNARTPMVWDSKSSESKFWIDFIANAKAINVEADMGAEKSVYHAFAKIMKLRQDYQVFQSGIYQQQAIDNKHIYAYSRILDKAEAVIISNFFNEEVSIDYANLKDYQVLFNNYDTINWQGNNILLKPYQAIVFFKER
jgi:trehalose-6-phosphate hydrolase